MSPAPPQNDQGDRCLGNAELCTERSLRFAFRVSGANLLHVFLSEFVHRLPLSGPAMLLGHVLKVVFPATKPEMGGITARWVVAAVAHLKSVRYRAFGQDVSMSMRAHNLAADRQLAVFPVGSRSHPRPTFLLLPHLDMSPEALSRMRSSIARKHQRAVSPDTKIVLLAHPTPVVRAIAIKNSAGLHAGSVA